MLASTYIVRMLDFIRTSKAKGRCVTDIENNVRLVGVFNIILIYFSTCHQTAQSSQMCSDINLNCKFFPRAHGMLYPVFATLDTEWLNEGPNPAQMRFRA